MPYLALYPIPYITPIIPHITIRTSYIRHLVGRQAGRQAASKLGPSFIPDLTLHFLYHYSDHM